MLNDLNLPNTGGNSDNQSQRTDLLILVHPQSNFDKDRQTEDYCRAALLGNLPSRTLILSSDVTQLIISGSKDSQIEASKLGEIPREALAALASNDTVTLLGGYAGNCHMHAFLDIVEEINSRKLSNVAVRIPYAGVYVSWSWSENRDGKRYEGPEGMPMQILEAPPTKRESYTLLEIGALKYDIRSLPNHHSKIPLLRNAEDKVIPTTTTERDEMLFRVYFENYLYNNASEHVKIPFTVRYEDEACVIVLNPDTASISSYEQSALATDRLDRYPLLPPGLLAQKVREAPDQVPLLIPYFDRIQENFPRLTAIQIHAYAEIFQTNKITDFDNAFALAELQQTLNEAIGQKELETIAYCLKKIPKPVLPWREVRMIPYDDHKGPEILNLIAPHLSKYDIQDTLHTAVHRNNIGVVRVLLKYKPDLNQVNSSSRMSPLVEAWTDDHHEMFNLLLESGADPHNPGKIPSDNNLGTIAVFGTEKQLSEFIAKFTFTIEERDSAIQTVRSWNVTKAKLEERTKILSSIGKNPPR